jgi:colanic acid biosynthesis protein WcaH
MILKENKMFLEKDIFKCIVEFAPLVSIDFLIKKDNKYLLGQRVNSPAKGYYFTIGGRIFKNETIQNAKHRILKEELNLFEKRESIFIGIFEHFYTDSVFGKDISTHYINLAYLLEFDIIINNLPLNQHNKYIWLDKEEILNRDDVHKYVKDYFKGSQYV